MKPLFVYCSISFFAACQPLSLAVPMVTQVSTTWDAATIEGTTPAIPSPLSSFTANPAGGYTRLTNLRADAFRWCRLAERGLNSRVSDANGQNPRQTDGTRFWGNFIGGPDVSHPVSVAVGDTTRTGDVTRNNIYRSVGPFTSGGVCPQVQDNGLWVPGQPTAATVTPVITSTVNGNRGQPTSFRPTADGPGNNAWRRTNLPAGVTRADAGLPNWDNWAIQDLTAYSAASPVCTSDSSPLGGRASRIRPTECPVSIF